MYFVHYSCIFTGRNSMFTGTCTVANKDALYYGGVRECPATATAITGSPKLTSIGHPSKGLVVPSRCVVDGVTHVESGRGLALPREVQLVM